MIFAKDDEKIYIAEVIKHIHIHKRVELWFSATKKRKKGGKVRELSKRLDNLVCALIIVFLFVTEPNTLVHGIFNKH